MFTFIIYIFPVLFVSYFSWLWLNDFYRTAPITRYDILELTRAEKKFVLSRIIDTREILTKGKLKKLKQEFYEKTTIAEQILTLADFDN